MPRTATPAPRPAGPAKTIFLISVLFFFSGAAGLIYQTVWVRLLELYFGVTLTAVTLIVSAYMAGLGLGSMLGGKIASRSRNPILLYGLIEAGIGVCGAVSPALLNWVGQSTAGSPYLLVFLFSFILLLVPTLLMGMTLPLLTQAFVDRLETSGQVIGLLYGINTFGAAIGALISGYILMSWFGFGGALLVAVSINFLVGLGAIFLRRSSKFQPEQGAKKGPGAPAASRTLWNYQAILASAFLVGFIDMGYEMLWFRVLGIFGKQTAYNFPSVLLVFLVALAVGGWYWGKKADSSKTPVALFWKLQIGIGIISAISFLVLWGLVSSPQTQAWLQEVFNNNRQPIPPFVRTEAGLAFSIRIFLSGLAQYFLPILIMVLPAGLLMGGGLPVLDRIAINQVALSGRRVGDIHLSNIAGSVLGTLAVSFAFLPFFGSEITSKILSALSISFLGIYLLTSRKHVRSQAVYLLPFVLVVLIFSLPGKGKFYTRLYGNATSEKSVAIRESGDGLLAITFRGDKTDPSGLWIGGLKNSYFPSDGEYQRSAMACAAAAQPRRILLIGLGGANTAQLLVSLPGVQEVVIVELMEELGSFLHENVPVARTVLDDSSVNYIIDDGRRYLYANPDEKFDLIFIDPLWSFTAGHNNLYSREALRLYQSHLSEGGVFCAWVNEKHFIPRTAAAVFPYSDMFDDFLVNSDRPISYDLEYFAEVYAALNTTSALSPQALETMEPQAILTQLQRGQAATLEFEQKVPVLEDMRPWLEYYYFCPPYVRKNLTPLQTKYCTSKIE